MRFSARAGIAAAAVGITVLGVAAVPRDASAYVVPVACVDCAKWWDMALSYGLQAKQHAIQVAERVTNLRNHALMIQNTLNLPRYVWGQIQNDTQQIAGLFNGARYTGMGFSNAGYQVAGLAGQAGGLVDNGTAYGHWFREANRSYDYIETLFGRQRQGQANERPAIGQAQQQVSGALGTVQGLGGVAQLTALGVNEQARTTAAVQLVGQHAVNESRINREQQGIAHAQLQHFIGGPPMPTSGGRRW